MIARLLEMATGKDDLERVAYKDDLELLKEYLKKLPVWIPKKPTRFLNAATFTQEQLMALIQADSKELAGDHFEPWILELEGKKRLPAFSSQKKLEVFSARRSQEMNKVFPLG